MPSYAATLQNQILGISGAPLQNAQKRLNIVQQATVSPSSDETIKIFYENAPKEITTALKPFGYFHSKVTSNLLNKGNHWYAIFTIQPGPSVKIKSVDIQINGPGQSDPIFKNFLISNQLHTNTTLETDKFQNIKKNFLDLALSNGYLQAQIEKNIIQIDLKRNQATIVLHFETGQHFKFGHTTFHSKDFSADFLKRFLPFKEGNFYTADKVQELQNNLNNSNFFTDVSVIPQTNAPKFDTIPIDINLKSHAKFQYDLGLGFGTDTGIRGLLGMEVRHLTKTGQSLRTSIKASQPQTDLEVHYLIPGKNPMVDQYDLSGAYEARNQPLGKSQAYKISAGYITSIFNDWKQTIRLGLQNERYTYINQPRRNSLFLIPSYNLLHTNVDNIIQPTHGHRINFIVQGSADKLISDRTFLQTQLDLKYLFPLTSYNPVILRATAGYTAINDIYSLPVSLQFFTGGSQTIRGYAYNGLGPGRVLAVGSVELRQKIMNNWYMAGFFDLGNSGNSFHMKYKRGVGLGLVWLSPVGTIELTYAKALDNPGTPGMLQFSMGPEF